MAHVVTELDSRASPEAILHALTDFSPKRFELFSNVDRRYFESGEKGDTWAEVTEGSPVFGGVWERSRYDWSEPGTVRIEVKDSNAFASGSYWKYEITPRPDGGSHVHMEFDRRPKNLRGKVLSVILTLFGKQMYEKQFGETLKKLEG